MSDITATCIGIGIGALGRDPSRSRFYDACGVVHSVKSESCKHMLGREGGGAEGTVLGRTRRTR